MNGDDFKFVQEERHTELVNSVTLVSVTRCKQSFWRQFLGDGTNK